jgi:hemerythrin superfamily protein
MATSATTHDTHHNDQTGSGWRRSIRGAYDRSSSWLGEGNNGLVVGAAAVGLVAGLAANLGRKAMVQGVSAMSGDWFDALKTEHALTLKVFDAIEATSDSQTMKRSMLLMQLKHALSKHALEEENAIYPALRDAGEKDAADKLNSDHGYVKQYLYDLSMLPKDSPAWIAKVREFRSDIEEHIREEESELFPRLRARLSADQNATLTSTMNKEGFKLA